MKELVEFLKKKYGSLDLAEHGFSLSLDDLLKYLLYVYTKDESDPSRTLTQKKEEALSKMGIKGTDSELLMFNKRDIISYIITDILHKTADRQFEMYVSAHEAATILLEVVRRPIDDKLEDEKWYNALKAKKQGFNDARELIKSANEIAEDILGAKEIDLEDHVDDTVFRAGSAERLAKMLGDKKAKEKKT